MSNHLARLSALLLMLALLAVSAVVLEAQDATPEATSTSNVEATAEATTEPTETVISDLSYNTAVTGTITASSPTQIWPLQAASADRIYARVERLDGNLLPDVQILDATGNVLGQSYGPDKTGAAAETNDFTLAAAGQYQVQVSRKDGENGVTTGQYRLTVFAAATAQDNINNTTIIGTITPGTPIDGEVTATHWYQLYTYTAVATDQISVSIERTSGNLMPLVYILDANGNSLSNGYTENTGDVATIETYTLPSPGTYTIAVSRYNDFNGDTVGQYRLTMTLLGAGEGSPSLQGTAGVVEYDKPLTGELTGAQWYQDWTLTTKAGDAISIEATRTGGNLKPAVVLLGGSGQQLTRAYVDPTGDHAGVDYSLETPGTYTVRVSRDGDQTGPTTGSYSLTVHLTGSGEGSPDLAETSGTITVGTPVSGEITNARWENTWTFQGTGKDNLTIDVKRTSGTLMPTIEIRDVNGQRLNYSYTDASGDTSTLNYQLPATGSYQIVVLRNENQTGQTTGGYKLAVTQAAQ